MTLVIRLVSFLIAGIFCFALEKIAGSSLNSYFNQMIMYMGIYVTLAVSLNLINGITGQFSIGHAAFCLVGAYAGAVLGGKIVPEFAKSSPYLFLVCSGLCGATTAGIAGLLVGLPSLRLKGDYLAVVTLGIGEIVSIVARNQKYLGEAYGLPTEKVQSIAVIWLLAILCIAVCRNLLKSAHGLAFLAVREDEIASSAMGVDITKVKVIAFVVGSAFAGAAGAMFAHTTAFVSTQNFNMDMSFIILTMVVLGGTGSITGTTLAAIALYYIPEKMRDIPPMYLAWPVAILLGIVIAVSGFKRTQDHFHGPKMRGLAINFGILALAITVSIIGAKLLGRIPAMQATVSGSNLRMPVLAITLVVFMLLRPQGIFGQHEFSWDWLLSKLGHKKQSEVTA
jgi:branched-chain amino acid transport system permease protein